MVSVYQLRCEEGKKPDLDRAAVIKTCLPKQAGAGVFLATNSPLSQVFVQHKVLTGSDSMAAGEA